jgi:hypothetical protein
VGATPPAYIDELCSALKNAATDQKLALLRVLRAAQGPKALDAVRAAIKDADTEVRGEAISILCGWPSVEALDDVLRLTTASDRKVKILALRGAIRLIPLQDASVAGKLGQFKELEPLIERNEEKRLLLGSLAEVPHKDALEMAIGYLDNAATKNEACFAAVAIAEKIATKDKSEVADAMKKVLEATTNNDLKKRAKQTLDKGEAGQ